MLYLLTLWVLHRTTSRYASELIKTSVSVVVETEVLINLLFSF